MVHIDAPTVSKGPLRVNSRRPRERTWRAGDAPWRASRARRRGARLVRNWVKSGVSDEELRAESCRIDERSPRPAVPIDSGRESGLGHRRRPSRRRGRPGCHRRRRTPTDGPAVLCCGRAAHRLAGPRTEPAAHRPYAGAAPMDAPETGPAARLDAGSLVIDRIETIALRAPLGRRFSGSAYSMDNRCTIVVRLTTADGVTAETYSGDTDDEQALIVGIIHDELAPARSWAGPRATPRAAGATWSPPPTTSSATAASRSRPSPRWTPRSGTRSAGPWACRSTGCGVPSPTRCRSRSSAATTTWTRRRPPRPCAATWSRASAA